MYDKRADLLKGRKDIIPKIVYNIDLTDVRINGKKTVIFCASMDSSGRVELHLHPGFIIRARYSSVLLGIAFLPSSSW